MTNDLSQKDLDTLSDDELDAYLASLQDAHLPDEVLGQGAGELKSGFVALVGRPNSGKSTLLNACMGEKIAITSPVAQTTRRRLRAVVRRPNTQIVIVDTPGLHKPKDGLGAELNRTALGEMSDVDVVVFALDATAPFGRGDAWILERMSALSVPKLLVITKADLAGQDQVHDQIQAASTLVSFADVMVVSAQEGFNVEAFVSLVASYLPKGPAWFPEDMDTDEPDEMLVAEFIREKVLRRTKEEVPHSVGVVCNTLERGKGGLVRIHATIYVEREGQKGILIGKGGEMIKRVGTDARRDLERLFGARVYLDLDVGVKTRWRDSDREIQLFGYGADGS
ncbi:GTPase Era [Collinsella sp. AGMB00827]|uniref:GTPase Era n=1 Tax=Collinsella ureilytica TaxID=2869515 RepID=A0ABS7ML24_9ACTN|nr:GTPase Era [Collinsella urealyticum]MBY4797977.1 GTPase Era [Collinsella urealyticum]